MGTPSHAEAISAQDIAGQFVRHYYNLMHSDPSSLHRLYKDDSSVAIIESNSSRTVSGLNDIKNQIASLNYKDCKVKIHVFDAQDSLQDSKIVTVLGTLATGTSGPREFVQTFVLAVQSKGFYVRNDMFRYLDLHQKATANTSFRGPKQASSRSGNAVTKPIAPEVSEAAPQQSKPVARRPEPTQQAVQQPTSVPVADPLPVAPPAKTNPPPAAKPAAAPVADKPVSSAPKSWASVVGVPTGPAASAAPTQNTQAQSANNNNNNNNNTQSAKASSGRDNNKGGRGSNKDRDNHQPGNVLYVSNLEGEHEGTIAQVFSDFAPVKVDMRAAGKFAYLTFSRPADVESVMNAVSSGLRFGTPNTQFVIERTTKSSGSGTQQSNGRGRRGGNRGRGRGGN